MKNKFINDFPGKEQDEKIVMIVRRHWTLFAGHIFMSIVYFSIPIVVYFLVSYFLVSGITEFQFFPAIVLLVSLYYSFWCLFLFKGFVDFYFDAWIITNTRLIDIDQKGFFDHTTAELRLDKIQDIVVEVKGFFPSIFHYGTIKAQTAAAVQLFSLEEIPDPDKIKNIIAELQSQIKSNVIISSQDVVNKQ